MTDRVEVRAAEDLDAAAVRAVAAGAGIDLSAELVEGVAARRRTALRLLADGPEVYGVSTGMGSLSGTRLTEEEQVGHSQRLMLARAVGGPPYLSREETRALVAVRLRTFLTGDAAVSAGLCEWLARLLDHEELLPDVPRTGSGAAGEILPLAHAWLHLSGVGEEAAAAQQLGAPALGPKEGLALIAGVPAATALTVLRAAELRRFVDRATIVASASILVARASRDPYEAPVARDDAELAEVLRTIRWYVGAGADVAGTSAAPVHLQAPVSFRVVGPVFAQLRRSASGLEEVAGRAMSGVTDSPALLDLDAGPRFVGTAGFHGLDLAAACESARAATVHAASVGVARLHRLLDTRVTGLSSQLSVAPGPMGGLAPLHKWAAARVHEIAGGPASYLLPMESSLGQEDVQTFALEAAERLRGALAVAREVLACELLAAHLAGLLEPARLAVEIAPGGAEVRDLLGAVADALPDGGADRPWGRDVACLVALLVDGWGSGAD